MKKLDHPLRYVGISYEALRLLHLELLSRIPRALLERPLSMRDVEWFISVNGKAVPDSVLLKLLMRIRAASEELVGSYRDKKVVDLFIRFREEQAYHHFIVGVLAACGCVNDDLRVANADSNVRRRRWDSFLGRLNVVLVHHEDYFSRVFRHAFLTLALAPLSLRLDSDEALHRISREMRRNVEERFWGLVCLLRMSMMNDDTLWRRRLSV